MDWLTLTTYFNVHPETGWLAVAAVFLLLELYTIPGIGFLFIGLAALTTGGLLAFGALSGESSFYLQLAWVLGFTCVWAAVLWVPLKRMRRSPENYHNMIGTSATAMEGALEQGKIGMVKWSGALMRARLVPHSHAQKVAEGAEVWIHEVDGTLLLVDTVPPEK